MFSAIDACRGGGRAAVSLNAADHHGYAIDETEVVYWGVCPGCSAPHSAQ